MRRKSWNMTPSVRRRKGSLRRFMRIMSKPLTVISPAAAWTSPVSSFMMVVLPEPEGPTRNSEFAVVDFEVHAVERLRAAAVIDHPDRVHLNHGYCSPFFPGGQSF